MKFKEYHEVRSVVDDLTEMACYEEASNYDNFGTRMGAAAGEFGKSVLGGVGSAIASPVQGLWRAGKRAYLGRRGLEDNDARAEVKQSKETLVRALMSLEPGERDQEIEKFKLVLNSFKGQNRDSWSRMSNAGKWAMGFRGGNDYKQATS